MLPLSLLWPLGIIFGLWALLTLVSPEVNSAFRPQALQPGANPGPLRRFFSTTAGWAIFLSALGLLVILQPVLGWAQLVAIDQDGQTSVLAENHGYETSAGIALALVFFSVFLLVVATGFGEQSRPWHPALLFAAGICVFLLASFLVLTAGITLVGGSGGSTIHTTYMGGTFDVTYGALPSSFKVRAGTPLYACQGIGLGLLLVGAVEFRRGGATRQKQTS
jgi:hypothetical protein